MAQRLTYADAARLSPTLVDAVRALNGAGLRWGTLAALKGVSLKVQRAAGMTSSPTAQSTWLKQRTLPLLWTIPGGQMDLTFALAIYKICRIQDDPLTDEFGLVQPIALARAWRTYRDIRPDGVLQVEYLSLGATALEADNLSLRACKECHTLGLVLATDLPDMEEHGSFERACLTCRLKHSLVTIQHAHPRRPRSRKATVVPSPLEDGIESTVDGEIAGLFHRIGLSA